MIIHCIFHIPPTMRLAHVTSFALLAAVALGAVQLDCPASTADVTWTQEYFTNFDTGTFVAGEWSLGTQDRNNGIRSSNRFSPGESFEWTPSFSLPHHHYLHVGFAVTVYNGDDWEGNNGGTGTGDSVSEVSRRFSVQYI